MFVVLTETARGADCCISTGAAHDDDAAYHVYLMLPSLPVPPNVIVAVNVTGAPFTQAIAGVGAEVIETPVGHMVAYAL